MTHRETTGAGSLRVREVAARRWLPRHHPVDLAGMGKLPQHPGGEGRRDVVVMAADFASCRPVESRGFEQFVGLLCGEVQQLPAVFVGGFEGQSRSFVAVQQRGPAGQARDGVASFGSATSASMPWVAAMPSIWEVPVSDLSHLLMWNDRLVRSMASATPRMRLAFNVGVLGLAQASVCACCGVVRVLPGFMDKAAVFGQ